MFKSAPLRVMSQVIATTAIVALGFECSPKLKKKLLSLAYLSGEGFNVKEGAEFRGFDELQHAALRTSAEHIVSEGQKAEVGPQYTYANKWDFKGRYKGTWLNGKKEGHGMLRYNNKYVYEGQFSNDLPHGQGKVTLPNGDVLSGTFVNGVLQGHEPIPEFGCSCIRTEAGLLVEGDLTFLDGNSEIFSGHGRIIDVFSRQCYRGQILCGVPEGKGKMYTFRGENTLIQEGTFDQGRIAVVKNVYFVTPYNTATRQINPNTGRPFLVVEQDEDVIVAGEVDGRLQGYGVVVFRDGSIARGMFYRNEMYGEWTVVKKKDEICADSDGLGDSDVGAEEERGGEDWWRDDSCADVEVVTVHLSLSPANRIRMWLEG